MIIETEDFKIECLGEQEIDVYDIEVEDNHNFFANDILVHNSCYVTLDPIVNKYINQYKDKHNGNEPSTREIHTVIQKIIDGKLQKVVNESLEEFQEEFNFLKHEMKMGREKICDVVLFKAKKHYMMSCIDDEGKDLIDDPKISIKGIKVITTTTPKVIKQDLKDICMELLQHDSEPDYKKMVRTFQEKWGKLSISERAIPKSVNNMLVYEPKLDYNGRNIGLNNYIDRYKEGDTKPYTLLWALKTPQHVKGSHFYNYLCTIYDIKKQRIEESAKISFVHLKEKKCTYNSNSIAFLTGDTLPEEFGLNDFIDFDQLWKVTVAKLLDGIGETLGYKSILKEDVIEEGLW